MGLLDRAKKTANKNKTERDREQDRERLAAKERQSLLGRLRRAALAGMREFDGVPCKTRYGNGKGTLRLVTGKRGQGFPDRVAILVLNRGKDVEPEDLLYVYAGIESGVFDGSDDCRNIPYTEARVKIATPNDSEPYRGADHRRSCEIPAWFAKSATEEGDGERSVKVLLENVADYLSPLFEK